MTQAPDGAEGLKTRPSRDEVEVEIDLSYPDADVTKYVISPKSTSAKKVRFITIRRNRRNH